MCRCLGRLAGMWYSHKKRTAQCKDPAVRRNHKHSSLLSLGGREAGCRYTDVDLDGGKDFRLDPENWRLSYSPLGSVSCRKGGGVDKRRRRSPHLYLGLAFCNLRVLAMEIFQDLTWRVGALRSETASPKAPDFVSLPVALLWGLLQVSAPPLQLPSPQSPRPSPCPLLSSTASCPHPKPLPPKLSPGLLQAPPGL